MLTGHVVHLRVKEKFSKNMLLVIIATLCHCVCVQMIAGFIKCCKGAHKVFKGITIETDIHVAGKKQKWDCFFVCCFIIQQKK